MGSNVKNYNSDAVLQKIPHKGNHDTLRYMSFNVNGIKTLFSYHPWNQLNRNFDDFFKALEADIISLQELKLTPASLLSTNIGKLSEYKAFISLPKEKKGYSGVGLFIRIPRAEDSKFLKSSLTVVKAEEGVTGILMSPDFPNLRYRDLKEDLLIGGYPDDLEIQRALRLDLEGRCACVELLNNVVVFSIYCPANTGATDEGEKYRLAFLEVLLQRCRYLKFVLNKEIVILGDLNVSLNLIDHCDTIENLIRLHKVKLYSKSLASEGENFEKDNSEECQNFKFSTSARRILNDSVFSYGLTPLIHGETSQFLYDSTRCCQGRRMSMYTVWNTLKSARQVNYGSRVDYILTTSIRSPYKISAADTWPFLMGSDHCPIYTDFDISNTTVKDEIMRPTLKFEARSFYRLSPKRDISSMFSVQKPKRDQKGHMNNETGFLNERCGRSKDTKQKSDSHNIKKRQPSISSLLMKDKK